MSAKGPLPPPFSRRRALAVTAGLLLAATSARSGDPSPPPPAGGAPATPQPPASPAGNDWLAEPGTAVLGLGLLRVSPAKAGTPGTIRLRYEERPDDYASFDSVQLM